MIFFMKSMPIQDKNVNHVEYAMLLYNQCSIIVLNY